MDFKINKDDNGQPAPTEPAKGKQNLLLVLLLILVGAFAYLYFFTDLIRPKQEQKPAEAPQQMVKQPMPPRPADGEAKPSAAAPAAAPAVPAKPEAKKDEPPKQPESKKAEPAKPQPAPAAKPEPPKAKPEPPKAKPEPATEKKPAAPPEKKEQKPAPQKDAAKPADTAKAKPAAPVKADAKKPEAAKPEAKAEAKQKPAEPAKEKKDGEAKAPSAGPWTLVVGTYTLEEALANDMAKVRKAGLEPLMKSGEKKKTPMNRLHVADFSDRAKAQSELEKIRRLTSDAFVIQQGDKFVLYAGSYMLESRADSEKERLAAAGVTSSKRKAEVSISSKRLTAGTYSDRKNADAALKKLKEAGLKASLVSK